MATVHVHARFVRADGSPITGGAWRARLLDQDAISDDLLDEVSLDNEGRAAFLFDLSNASSLDTPYESAPDFYVVLLKDGLEAFRSAVRKDSPVLVPNPATGLRDGATVDLGMHVVDASEVSRRAFLTGSASQG
jgi:hypothetical protein